MEINKLSSQLSGQIDGTSAADKSRAAALVNKTDTSSSNVSDKVSLSGTGGKNNEEMFAKIELEKANQNSFAQLKDYKAKIQEYEAAKSTSPEAAQETELGKMLNDPAVWEQIAEGILR